MLQRVREDPVGANRELLAERSSKAPVQAATQLVQEALRDWGCEALGRDVLEGTQPDGILGPKTKAAIRSFQQHVELDDDAIVGPLTLRELDNEVGPPPPRPPGPPNPPGPPAPDPSPADEPKVEFDSIGTPVSIGEAEHRRLPPNTPSEVGVRLSGVDPEFGPKVVVTTQGHGKSGRLSLNRGFEQVDLEPGRQKIRLNGTQQTEPHETIKLRLVAIRTDTDEVIARSARIAVAAWPDGMEAKKTNAWHGAKVKVAGHESYTWAIEYDMFPSCETGDGADCDLVEIMEEIRTSDSDSQVIPAKKVLIKPPVLFGVWPDINGFQFDNGQQNLVQGLDSEVANLPDKSRFFYYHQRFRFKDPRTGDQSRIMLGSGFKLDFDLVKANGWTMYVTRTATAMNNGTTAGVADGETHSVWIS